MGEEPKNPTELVKPFNRRLWLKYFALIPGVAALASIVLYILGFLVVFSYMGGFGFSSYAIVNIKFIVAGLWALIGFLFAYYCFQYLHTIIGNESVIKKFFVMNTLKRCGCYFLLIFVPWGTSYIFYTVVNTLGEQPFGKSPDLNIPIGYGNSDIIGQLVSKYVHNFVDSPGYNFVISYTVYFSIYLSIALTFFKLIRFLVSKFFPSKEGQKTNKIVKSEIVVKPDLRKWWDLYVDAFCWIIIVLTVLYSYLKLRAERITIENFSISSIHHGTLYVWLMSIVISLLFFRLLGWEGLWKNKLKNQDELDTFTRFFLIPTIAAIISFGQVIYPRISYSIGGGKPREVFIHEKTESLVNAKEDKVYLIDETSDYYFLVVQTPTKNKAIQLKKENVEWIEIIKQASSSTR